jgi:2-oxoglutarate dehydrogenase complex dehydrogenase (E1) component-like enzyme
VLPILVHGDAAFAGQGVVMETLNLAQTRGYGTGGTVHIVINNQIGFTTSDPRDARSTLYCSDVVKMIEAPVLHVNADDPEAVVLATQIAMDYRTEFHKDVVVDIICYRKLGHNEQDTPALTQPLMYKKIAKHPGTRKLYADKLVRRARDRRRRRRQMVAAYRDAMDAGKHTVDPVLTDFKNKYAVDWAPFLNKKWTDAADTAVPLTELKRLASASPPCRKTSRSHSLVEKVLGDRANMGRGEMNLDWGMGEHLAYASLVASGYAIRLSGQDAGRGTFVHRHAVLHDQNRERWDQGIYLPLANVSENQAPVHRDRLGAVGRSGAGLRIRLLDRRTEHADHLGSPVRRLRQRRPGRHRPVHRFGRSEVGPRLGPGHDAAARLRRPGSGALVGTYRALPAAVRRQQHASRAADHRRPDLPPAAPPDGAPVPQAAGHLHAEVAAA